jgi:hypothetical protein
MNTQQLPAFKKDSYMKRRGTPVMLEIFCAGCDGYIMHYQKDGPGPLKRCYLDRIHLPQSLEQRQYDEFNKKASPKLICEQCEAVIGSPIVYEKENRPAYYMRQGFFAKRIVKVEK